MNHVYSKHASKYLMWLRWDQTGHHQLRFQLMVIFGFYGLLHLAPSPSTSLGGPESSNSNSAAGHRAMVLAHSSRSCSSSAG